MTGFVLAEDACTDSDGGIDYYTKGDFSGFDSDLNPLESYETCMEGGQIIVEQYCGEDGTIQTEDYNCSEEGMLCYEGACVNTEDACTDSDGGIDYYTKGHLSNYYMKSEDSCDVNGNFLHELYCKEDGSFDVSEHSCLNEGKVCVGGACVDNDTTTEGDDEINENRTRRAKLHEKNRLRINQSELPEGCTVTGSVVKCVVNGGRVMAVFAGRSGNTILQVKGINASTKVQLYKENQSFYGVSGDNETKFLINYFPDQIIEIIRNRAHTDVEYEEEIELDEDGLYRVKTKKKARLFYLVPVREKVKAQVDPETGEIIKIRNPWWGFLAKDVVDEEPEEGSE